MNEYKHILLWWKKKPLTTSIYTGMDTIGFSLACHVGKTSQASNGTFCALHRWLYFMLCHLVCPRSSFPLCLFLTLLTFFLTLFARCFSLCASVCLTLLLYVFHSGAVMSVHSRAQRFEVLSNGTLVIQNIQLQDRGTYICSAQSMLGRDRWGYGYMLCIQYGCVMTTGHSILILMTSAYSNV